MVSGLSILGYLGVIIPMTVFTGRWLGKLVEHKNNPSISEKNKAAYVQLTICAVLVLVSSHSAKLKFYYVFIQVILLLIPHQDNTPAADFLGGTLQLSTDVLFSLFLPVVI